MNLAVELDRLREEFAREELDEEGLENEVEFFLKADECEHCRASAGSTLCSAHYERYLRGSGVMDDPKRVTLERQFLTREVLTPDQAQGLMGTHVMSDGQKQGVIVNVTLEPAGTYVDIDLEPGSAMSRWIAEGLGLMKPSIHG